MTMNKFALIGAVTSVIITLSFAGSAFAQTAVTATAAVSSTGIAPAGCVTPAPGLNRGAVGVRVTALQQSLAALGYFNTFATGYFGPITYGAVISFQRANALPATGYFGPLTYAALLKHCTTPTPTPSSVSFMADPTYGAAPLAVSFTASGVMSGSQYIIIEYGDGQNSGPLPTVCQSNQSYPGYIGSANSCMIFAHHTYIADGSYTATIEPYIACMWSNPRCMIATMPLGTVTITVGGTTAPPHINGIDPTSGPVGTEVTITGNKFGSDNTVHFGSGVILHVPISSTTDIQCFAAPCYPIQTLKFVVPGALDPACRFTTPVCGMPTQMTSPGTYPVYVENSNGSSNHTTFTVTPRS